MALKLIFDKSSMELIAKKLTGHPIYAGPNGGLLEPGIIDMLDEETYEQWQPSNELAKLVLLAVEACKDILFYKEHFKESSTRKRAMKRMTVPICSLIDVIRELISKVNKNKDANQLRESNWPTHDKEIYKKLVKRIKKIDGRSSIRRIRNKLSAHLDSDVFIDNTIKFEHDDILEPLGDCIIILMLSMNYPSEFFHWIRFLGKLEDKEYLVVETMYSYPVCTQWITDEQGHVKDIGNMTVAADPRHELREVILEIVKEYNDMVKIVNSKLPTIFTIESEKLLEKENEELNNTSESLLKA